MKIIPIPCYFDNYAWLLLCEKERSAIVIDPSEAAPLLQALTQYKVKLTAIYCTHHHNDHVEGIKELCNQTDVRHIFCHNKDRGRIKGATDSLQDGDLFSFSTYQGRVLYTPGHTLGSVCYHINDYLFTGDTLFSAGCGRLFEGKPTQMLESLQKIAALADTTKICFGHEYTLKNLEFALSIEPDNKEICSRYRDIYSLRKQNLFSTPSTLGIEKRTNPFLRCSSPTLQNLYGLTSEIDIFTTLREARNNF